LQTYVLGLLAARLGLPSEVEVHLRQLATTSPPPGGETLVERLQRSLEGQLRRACGDWVGALAALEAAPSVWFQLAIASPFYAGALDRFTRAELLAGAGLTPEALGWWTAIAERTPWEIVFAAPAARRAGEAYERLDQRAAALREYQRFVAWWRDSDPAFAGEVEQIRGRIGMLEG
jgi:tetratricopeptide (TPR) repeat protein